MHTIASSAPAVNGCTRPVKSLTGTQLHPLDDGSHVLILFTKKGSKFYHLSEIETQLGGRAFRLEPFTTDKLATDEDEYVVRIDGADSSCTCSGHSYTGGCKHVSALLAFAAGGGLSRRAAS
jgi:hypothetical protein